MSQTIKYRAAKEKGGQESSQQGKGSSSGREIDRGFFKRLPFICNLHTLLSHDIISQGQLRTSVTLVFSCFCSLGSRSWEGMNFIINYTPEYEISLGSTDSTASEPPASVAGEGSLCWINIHFRALGFLWWNTILGNSQKEIVTTRTLARPYPFQSLPEFSNSTGHFSF